MRWRHHVRICSRELFASAPRSSEHVEPFSKFTAGGSEPESSTPEQFAQMIRDDVAKFAQIVKADYEKWGPIVRSTGFTAED